MSEVQSEDPETATQCSAGASFPGEHGLDRETLLRVADTARLEMEELGAEIRDLVLAQPPIQLLGYVMGHFHIAMKTASGQAVSGSKNKTIKGFQLALEYLHAVWSCHAPTIAETAPLDEVKAGKLFPTFERLQIATWRYCMASSAGNPTGEPSVADLEFHAKSTWTLIRGNRYQVLEGEFFRYVFAPHEDALRQAYGVGADDVAAGIQAIADALRSGMSNAVEGLQASMERAQAAIDETGDDLGAVLERMSAADPDFRASTSDLIRDMLFGGICNLSRHSRLPRSLLDDLAWMPGENDEFYAPGAFSGTPLRTLPARVKPGIVLGGDVYATDGQFVRDSAYRAIQRGLWKRLPYRDEWLKRQAVAVEDAFPSIFARQLAGAEVLRSVHYREVDTGRWVEADRVILLADLLIVVEAKAGNQPMQSPATSYASHERAIRELLLKAYNQCQRFVKYLASAREVPLFELSDGQYVEVRRLRGADYRIVLPIGLTVEAFTPFSALAKELPGVEPILDRHPFVSMSVDDLFVLSRFLPTTGELLHYFSVRQQVASIRGAMLFDEIDHLGAYIRDNRFDLRIRDQLKTAHQVFWSEFSDIVDRHFEGEDWESKPVPTQTYPAKVAEILRVLDERRPDGWLRIDRHLRDYGIPSREDVARFVEQLEPTLQEHPRRRFDLGGDDLLQVWLCRAGAEPAPDELRLKAQASCLVLRASEAFVLVLTYRRPGVIASARCETMPVPNMLQSDWTEVNTEAERQRKRVRPIGPAKCGEVG
ncbi:MAG: hypothetical protein SF002_04575 [Alphaproteobacteria bacterium]|nr:hypothetical protein [Alphaproteobacteria bacterium]